MFSGIGGAAEALGLAGELRGLGPAAGFDEAGNLWLDRDIVERVRTAFLSRRDPDYLEDVERVRSERCAALVAATNAAARAAATPDLGAGEARGALEELAAATAGFIPYPILTKFVPDLLLQTLVEAGHEGPPPFLNPSPGGRLSMAMLDLYGESMAMGYPVARLEQAWPSVDPSLARAVRAFCQRHTGFGPVTWEAPGFETPAFLFASLRSAFGDADPVQMRSRLRRSENAVDPDVDRSQLGRLRGYVRSWLELLDLEIWYLRGGFYRGILPLLRRGGWWLQGVDAEPRVGLLFAQIDELLAGPADRGVLEERRRRYLSSREYLDRHAVGADRLASLMEGP